ncbi:GNAT family N-acetyltransferase [Sedimentibacter hydroxybenzoicus DSM 7310]|uniref:GNAT family N-acetyltransferase n=2 Tax=Sedimentibacter hydroxybenzoicus TaxID=29345 RepID=A0A974BHW9_SEDHY|nr:GNAT family N-acetyltransferase [Sedimentibacter hydroxybenzoicus DSM 7310]
MESLIQSVLDLKGSSQVIVGITLNNEELKTSIENLPKLDATIIDVGDQAFQLLDKLIIRQARLSEFPLLKDFLYEAIFVPYGNTPPSKQILLESGISAYIDNFGEKESDICYVAKKDGDIIGMAWVRICGSYGYVDDQTPELAISIRPEHRSKGIGTKLLSNLLSYLKDKGYKQTSLSVQKSNPAVRLYKRLGYKIVKESEKDFLMIKYL